MRHADLVLWLLAPDVRTEVPPDLSEPGEESWRHPPIARIATKADLGEVADAEHRVSVTTGDGISELLDLLYEASGAGGVRAGEVLVSHEQDRAALLAAIVELGHVGDELERSELAAERLRRAGMALERLLGRMDAEAVLDRLFSNFCIGK